MKYQPIENYGVIGDLHTVALVGWLCDHWQNPDNGIWEVRGGQREFLYSRLMSWVALDRALRLANKRSLPAPLERWYEVRDNLYNDIFENFWDDKLGAFSNIVARKPWMLPAC